MPSFENPVVPETARFERFLEKEGLQRSILTSLADVFAFIRKAEGEGGEKILHGFDMTDPDLSRDLAFQERYGANVLEASFGTEEELTEEARAALADYREFCDALGDAPPDFRPRLLAALAPMSSDEASWEQGRAFTDLMTALYGQEKKAEGGKEYFLALEGQADLVEAWSIKGGWGFSKEEFAEVRKEIPSVRERMKKYAHEPLVAPVLVPSFDDGGDAAKGGAARTLETLLPLIGVGHEKFSSSQRYEDMNASKVRAVDGGAQVRRLAFEIIGLGDHRGETPDSVRSKEGKLPGAGVIAAAALNPDWIRAMDEKDVPMAWAAGYEMTLRNVDYWGNVPLISFIPDRGVEIEPESARTTGDHVAVPSFRE